MSRQHRVAVRRGRVSDMAKRVLVLGTLVLLVGGAVWYAGWVRGWWDKDSRTEKPPDEPVTTPAPRPEFWGRRADRAALEKVHKDAADLNRPCPMAVVEAICDEDEQTRSWARDGVATFQKRISP